MDLVLGVVVPLGQGKQKRAHLSVDSLGPERQVDSGQSRTTFWLR